jgi:mono/diheme cytochrome c family protein
MKALMILTLAIGAAAQTPAAPAKVDGPKIFTAKCSACHGKDGKGSASMGKMLKLKDVAVLNLSSAETAKETDEALTKTILAGHDKMPAFKGKLKDAEVSALLEYIRALAPAPAVPAAPQGSPK